MFRWYTNEFKNNLGDKLEISEIIDIFTCEDISSHLRISYHFYQFATIRYTTDFYIIINNYSPKWRWIVVDILPSRFGEVKYPPTFTTLRWIIVFSIYHTSWITSRPKSNFICDNVLTKSILFFFGCSEVNSTWLITSELANQRARKSTIHLCGIY